MDPQSKNQLGFIGGTAIFAILAIIISIGATIGIVSNLSLNYQQAAEKLEAREDLEKTIYSLSTLIGDPDNDGTFEVLFQVPVASVYTSQDNNTALTSKMSVIPKTAGTFFINSQGFPIGFCSFDYGIKARNLSGSTELTLGGLHKLIPGQSSPQTRVTSQQVQSYPLFFVIDPGTNGTFEIGCDTLFDFYSEDSNSDATAFYSEIGGQSGDDLIRVVTYAETLAEYNPMQRMLSSLDESCMENNVVIRWREDGRPDCVEETDPSLLQLAKEQLPSLCQEDEVLTVSPTPESQQPGFTGPPDYIFTCQEVTTQQVEFEPTRQDLFSMRPGEDASLTQTLLGYDQGIPIYRYTKTSSMPNMPEYTRFALFSIYVSQFGVIQRQITLNVTVTDANGTQDYVLYDERETYTNTDTHYESFSVTKVVPIGRSATNLQVEGIFVTGGIPAGVTIPEAYKSRVSVVVDYMK